MCTRTITTTITSPAEAAQAVLGALDLIRDGQRERVVDPLLEIELALVVHVGGAQLVVAGGAGLVDLARIDLVARRSRPEAAHARAVHRRREAQPHRVPATGRTRDVQTHRELDGRHRVLLAREGEVLGVDVQLERPARPGVQAQAREIEGVRPQRHTASRLARACS